MNHKAKYQMLRKPILPACLLAAALSAGILSPAVYASPAAEETGAAVPGEIAIAPGDDGVLIPALPGDSLSVSPVPEAGPDADAESEEDSQATLDSTEGIPFAAAQPAQAAQPHPEEAEDIPSTAVQPVQESQPPVQELLPGQEALIPGGQSGTEQQISTEPSDWAKTEVTAAIDAGIVPESLRYHYQGSITRAETAQMVILLMEKTTTWSIDNYLLGKGITLDENAFYDTKDPDVLAANALGIMQGIGDGMFGPDQPLTRAALAAIVNRVARQQGIDTSGCAHAFTDVSGHWVDKELGWPAQNGIINGKGDGIFDPDGTLTTQEAILIVYRALNVLKK